MTNFITSTWRRPGPKNRIFALSGLETVIFIVEQCFWAYSNRLEALDITCNKTPNPKSNMAASRARKPILSFYGHNFLPNWASSILRRHCWKSIEFCIEKVMFMFSIGCIDTEIFIKIFFIYGPLGRGLIKSTNSAETMRHMSLSLIRCLKDGVWRNIFIYYDNHRNTNMAAPRAIKAYFCSSEPKDCSF